MAEYGSIIKAAREKAGLTQEQLGEAIGVTGVTIMRYEKNQRTPSMEILGNIAVVLGSEFNNALIEQFEFSIRQKVKKENSEAITLGDIDNLLADKTISEQDKRSVLDRFGFTFQTQDIIRAEELKREMLRLFSSLNIEGKEKAVDMLRIMAGNPNLQHPDLFEQPEAPIPIAENTPVTQEKPPEGQTAQADGV